MLRRRLPLLLALLVGVFLGAQFLDGPLIGGGDERVVAEAIDEVADRYYREIPRDRLADGAISGIVASLDDRFSAYFDPKEYERFQQATSSAYEGVGMQVQEHDLGLRVVTVYDGSPAKRAGIRRGDVIVAAGGKSLAGRPSRASTELIKGPPGTEVTLRIRRDGRTRTERVTRARVTVPVVASSLRGGNVGVVRLAGFTSGAHGEVRTALEKLQKQGAKGFVLDLRGNGGGLVTEAQLVASAFLDDGPIVTTRGRAVEERTLSATGDPLVPRAPLVVLVDGGSASASEIVAGALADRGRAALVGTRTFGKGVFQQVIELSNGGALDITAGQYFTPSGRNLGGRGVRKGAGLTPKVRARDDPDTARDEALPVAVRAVRSKL